MLIRMRNCVGQSIANCELDTILPYILSRLDLELVEEGKPLFFLRLKFANSEMKVKAL